MQTVLTNARLILEDEIVTGTIAFENGVITAVDQGLSSLPAAVDAGGDYVAPGLVEMHTDNMEKHFMPRPKVFWPNGLAAALVHDAHLVVCCSNVRISGLGECTRANTIVHLDFVRPNLPDHRVGGGRAGLDRVSDKRSAPTDTDDLGYHIPVFPVKGYSITVPITDAAGAPESTVMDETHKVAVTRLGDRIRVGGTAELAGYSLALREPRRARRQIGVGRVQVLERSLQVQHRRGNFVTLHAA